MLKSVILLFILYTSDIEGLDRDGSPGYEYYPELHGWLKLHPEPAIWLSARVHCHLEGAFLTSTWTDEFTSAVNKLQSTGDTIPALYSGLHTTFAEGAYSYVKGEPLDTEYLVSFDRCGVIFANGTTGEVGCKEQLPYVCYAPVVPTVALTLAPLPASTPASASEPASESAATSGAPPTSESAATSGAPPTPAPSTAPKPTHAAPISRSCGNTTFGYEFANQTGNCYKFHTWAATWTDANSTCTAEGAQLAVINSIVESEYLAALFNKYPDAMIHNARDTAIAIAAIGFYRDEVSGDWITVNGQSLQEAGFNYWTFGSASGEDFHPYGFIDRSGTLMNYSSWSYKFPFICEKAPPLA